MNFAKWALAAAIVSNLGLAAGSPAADGGGTATTSSTNPSAKPATKPPDKNPAAASTSTDKGKSAAASSKPAAKPAAAAAKPATKPAVKPAAKPAGKPGVKPGVKPSVKPGTKPVAKTGTQPAEIIATQKDGKPLWLNFRRGRSAAQQSKKPMMVDMATSWCHWCHRLDEEVFQSPTVQSYLAKNVVCVRLDAEDRGEGTLVAQKYRVSGFPTVLFFSPDFNYSGRMTGYKAAEEFLPLVQQVVAGKKLPEQEM